MLYFATKNNFFNFKIEFSKKLKYFIATASKSQKTFFKMPLICGNIKVSKSNSTQKDIWLIWNTINKMVMGIIKMK